MAGETGPPAAGPVLVAKLRGPGVRAELVPRRRLIDLLAGPATHKLTLVDAPAGWGKTTLLAAWQDDPGEARPFAWVSLDRADNDPVRFWTYVVTALQTVRPGLGERALAALGGRGPSTRVLLPELINELASDAPELVLALDDYHAIEAVSRGGDALRPGAWAGCNTGTLPRDCRVMATRNGVGVEELSCREVVEILGDYLEGAMAPQDRARLEEHLAGCEGCAAYLEQLRTTIRLSGRLPEEAVAPETMTPLLEAFRAWRRG